MIEYMGLDLAQVSGVARAYDQDPAGKVVYVFQHKGNPVRLLETLEAYIVPQAQVRAFVEEHNHFRNAKTARGLIMRIGYIYHAFQCAQREISMANLSSVRSWLKAGTTKEKVLEAVRGQVVQADAPLSDNHSDAVAALLFGAKWRLDEVKVRVGPDVTDRKKQRSKK